MAYPYYPQNYYQQTQPTFMPQQPTQIPTPMQTSTQQNSGFNWVRGGESGANSYPVQPGRSELLMDADNPVFYIKTVDQSGMPMPLRVFDYTERKNEPVTQRKQETVNNIDYVSRSEFDTFKSEIKAQLEQPSLSTSKSTSRSVQSKKEE